MNIVLKKIIETPGIGKGILYLRKFQNDWNLYRSTNKRFRVISEAKRRIFYLGVPSHNNLGDLAQGVCIRRWIRKHYPEYECVEIETNALVNTRFPLLNKLKKIYKSGDFVVFQSGYTTTDLGGYADEMHRAVIQMLPDANILMMPQTIFFEKEENKKRTSEIYDLDQNMLFLARDKVSYRLAKNMFSRLQIELFPDIVTTLIGKYSFESKRDGIIFCCRDDGEKYYSDDEIRKLMDKCAKFCRVERTDTTKKGKRIDVVNNAEQLIFQEVEKYSKYKVMITDRYHGTILSLVAGTPVVIIKTTDHKVVTGAEWFHGIYDEYVYLAQNLVEAYDIAKTIYKKELDYKLESIFENQFYDKLPEILKKKWVS